MGGTPIAIYTLGRSATDIYAASMCFVVTNYETRDRNSKVVWLLAMQ